MGFCLFRDVSGNGSIPALREPRTHKGCSDRSQREQGIDLHRQ